MVAYISERVYKSQMVAYISERVYKSLNFWIQFVALQLIIMNNYRYFSYSLISLLFLFLSVISHPINDNHNKDPCLPLLGNSNPKYKDVKNCLTSFSYNNTRAKATIETLKSLTKDFYVFHDQAKEQPHPGFTFDPIDLEKELDKILVTHYKTDFDFLTDIRKLYKRLRDGHTQFSANCYSQFTFDQQLFLYSVVTNGKQVIKIFDDLIDPTNVDCEVTFIDSKPAMEEIKNFANNNSFISRDLGVRFNNVLTSLSSPFGNLGPSFLGSEFVYREDLPETDGIEYTLNCPNNKPKKFKREWLVDSFSTSNFNDSKSFFNNYCLYIIDSDSETPKKLVNPQKNMQYRQHTKTLSNNKASKPKYSLSQATLVYSTYKKKIQFYQSGDTGIVVIPAVPNYGDVLKGFKIFADKGIKKLVLDLSNNAGGFIEFVKLFNSIFAPAHSKHTIFPDDILVDSPSVRQAISASIGTGNSLDPTSFIDFKTGKPFKNAEDFIGSNKYERGGTFSRYSEKHNFDDSNLSKLPWDNTNTIIITNGVCGSACALISEYLNEVSKIRTIAVGGFYEEKLSFSSYTGGNNLDSDVIFTLFSKLKLKYVPEFEYLATLGFNFREAYSLNEPNVVLDFDFRPADFRLYYNEKNARDPSLLWVEASKIIDKLN
ncbi:hypothetical protein Glove_103g221 [Diversispora epigaea]|uniref:CPAF-like PDZ domain-containing protein n=1 Tax=Diversispora epigaea TaxID=1348612 RepID=A0A397JCT7_9GLOM|nr:hypothetical protein Glove_103g221 [Diversispora epigaea]